MFDDEEQEEQPKPRGDGIVHPAILARTPVSFPGRSLPVWASYKKYKRLMENAARICEMYHLFDDTLVLHITMPRDYSYVDLGILLYWWGPYEDHKSTDGLNCSIDWGDTSPEVQITNAIVADDPYVLRHYYTHWPDGSWIDRPRDFTITIHGYGIRWNQQSYPSMYDQDADNYDYSNLNHTLNSIEVPPGRRSIIRLVKRGCYNYNLMTHVSGNLFGQISPSDDNDISEMFWKCSSLVSVPEDLFDPFLGLNVNLNRVFKDCVSLQNAPKLWEKFPHAPHEECYAGTPIDAPAGWK